MDEMVAVGGQVVFRGFPAFPVLSRYPFPVQTEHVIPSFLNDGHRFIPTGLLGITLLFFGTRTEDQPSSFSLDSIS